MFECPYPSRAVWTRKTDRNFWPPCPSWSVLDFWKIKSKKSSLKNWIFSLFLTIFLLPLLPARINFKIYSCRLKIQLSNFLFPTWLFKIQVKINRGLGTLHTTIRSTKKFESEDCWPRKLCQSQEDCGTDGICYISYEDPYLGKIRFL